MVVRLLGVPYDAHSSFLRGAADAPTAVRSALDCGSANWCTESGVDLGPLNGSAWTDLGDLTIPDGAENARDTISSAVAEVIADGSRVVSVGGDHFVTWPIVQAVSAVHDDLTIVHFDAHPDLYDELDGDRYSHACPFARIMEEGRVARLLQFGIRTITPHQRQQADRFGVEVHEFRDWDGRIPELAGPVYISIDADALDPAFAPGVSHNEPGGMTTRQLLDSLRQIDAGEARVVGADVVEINPSRDVNDQTAMVGGKFVRELIGMMIDPQEGDA